MIAPISRRNSFVAIPSTSGSMMRRETCPRRAAVSHADGGWSFAFNPEHSAAAAPALWHPRACAQVAIAQPAPEGLAAIRLADLVSRGRVASEVIGYREWHLVLLVGGRRYRIAIRGCEENEEIAYIAPADAQSGLRLAIAAALHRSLSGEGEAPPPTGVDPGPTERWRLVQWLRLLDGSAAGASPRDLAAALLTAEARHYSAAEWDASSERRRIARWQRGALAMRGGGYRTLLSAS